MKTETKVIDLLIGKYQKVGDVSIITILGYDVFQKVGKIYNIFGFQIDLNKAIK